MRSKDNIINRVYEPLNVSARLVCLTDGSPATQVYNVNARQFEPDRELSPTVIYPDISAYASDGSWKNKQCNSILADMVWMVNGEDITKLKDWEGKYSVAQDGSMRGAITITRNLSQDERCSLTFKASIPDARLRTSLTVTTEELSLTTFNKQEDTYGISIGETEFIRYNPFLDKLALYDYKVAHGLATYKEEDRLGCYDGNQYERTIPVFVFQGEKEVSVGYDVKVCKVTGSSSVEEATYATGLVSANSKQVALDLRMIENADYLIRVLVGGQIVAQKQFNVSREYPEYEAEVLNLTNIYPDDEQKYHKALILMNNGEVECPESILSIKWLTVATDVINNSQTEKYWNEGAEVLYDIAETGIGDTIEDGIHVMFDAEQKKAHTVAIDKDGNAYTNADGEVYIIN